MVGAAAGEQPAANISVGRDHEPRYIGPATGIAGDPVQREGPSACTRRGPLPKLASDQRARCNNLAGVPGLEPRLTGPEPVGLPITPYPIAAAPESRSRPRSLAQNQVRCERDSEPFP